MAKRNRYGFDKRLRELKKKKKREEKLERKRMNKQDAQSDSEKIRETPAAAGEGLAPDVDSGQREDEQARSS
jgi:hypothetical protein